MQVYGYVSNCLGKGDSNWFVDNECFANSDSGGFASDCNDPSNMQIYGNHFYNRNGNSTTKLCNASNTLQQVPSDDDIIKAGLAKLPSA